LLSDRSELVSITGYRENNLRILEDIDASPYRYLEVASDGTARSISQELRFHYSGSRVDGVVGLIYTDAVYQDQFSVDVVAEFITAAGGSEPAITQRRSETRSIAVFSQWDWNVTDRLTLILGGRWSESDKELRRAEYVFTDSALSAASAGVERCFILAPGIGPDDQPACLTTLSIPGQGDVPLPPEITEGTGDGSWTQFSPKLGARFQVNDDVMAYASYSQGYRDGGFAGDAANLRPFDEEIVNAYEAGFKSNWIDGQLSMNGAVFFYDYQDLQIELSQLRNNLVSISVFNAGEAELMGAEIESTWLSGDSFRLSLDVGWLETEITELDQSDPSLDFGFLRPGNAFPQAPEWTASLVPEFYFPLANGSLTWRSEFNYKGSYFQDAENGGFADESDALILTGANIADGVPPADATVAPGTLIDSERLDSRLIVNTSLTFVSADDRLDVSVWARNLFEEEYTVNRDFVNGLVYTNSLYGTPRTYGANASYRF
jgi:iron complex outermembrane receptor protein